MNKHDDNNDPQEVIIVEMQSTVGHQLMEYSMSKLAMTMRQLQTQIAIYSRW